MTTVILIIIATARGPQSRDSPQLYSVPVQSCLIPLWLELDYLLRVPGPLPFPWAVFFPLVDMVDQRTTVRRLFTFGGPS